MTIPTVPGKNIMTALEPKRLTPDRSMEKRKKHQTGRQEIRGSNVIKVGNFPENTPKEFKSAGKK